MFDTNYKKRGLIDSPELALSDHVSTSNDHDIKKYIRALKYSDDVKGAILKSALDAIITINEKGEILEFNPSAEKIFGYSIDEVIGKNIAEIIIPPNLRDQHRKGFNRFLKTGDKKIIGKQLEITAIRASGEEFPVELTLTNINLDNERLFTAFIRDITERVQVERDLKESECKYRSLAEGSLQGIIVHREFKTLFANQKCAEIFGYKNPDEILALDSILTAFWSPEERERINKYKTDRMSGKYVPATYENKVRRKDGSESWFESYVTTVDWLGEKAIQAAIIDISERKRIESELKESEHRYRTIFEAEPECVQTLSEDGSLLHMNPAGLAMIEADSFGEVKGVCVYDLIAPEYRDDYIDMNRRVFNGETCDLQFQLEGLKGTRRWLESHAVPVYESGSDSDVIEHLAVTRDITKRIKAQNALKESEEKFSKAFRSNHISMSLSELETGRFLEVNNGFEKLTGYSREQAIGRTSLELNIFANPDDRQAIVHKLKKDGVVHDFDVIANRLNGEIRHILFFAEIIKVGEDKLMISSHYDMTERKQSEHLQDAQEKILKQIISGVPQKDILTDPCLMFESLAPKGARATTSLLNIEEQKLYVAAAPSMPEKITSAFQGLIIGEANTSCGTAAYKGQTVIVEDIRQSSLWKDYCDFALENGMQAVWSKPFFSEKGGVLA